MWRIVTVLELAHCCMHVACTFQSVKEGIKNEIKRKRTATLSTRLFLTVGNDKKQLCIQKVNLWAIVTPKINGEDLKESEILA